MSRTFQIINPADGSVLAERAYFSTADIEKKLLKSTEAFNSWRSTPLADRLAFCQKAMDYMQENADVLAEEITKQMGRPSRYSSFEIKGGLRERSQYMMDIAEKALADRIIDEEQDFHRFVRREPLGTVLILAPWNYPYLTAVNALIPALVAGNTVILKHAEQTALCAERFAEAFEQAGLPEGVFQFIHMDHAQVANVIQDSRINYVAFTGSVEGGEAVQKSIGPRFINSGLELGGKDPGYVCEDADLQSAIDNLVDGSFFNSGQSCCGIERIYAHEKVYDDFVEGFVKLTKTYQVGDPMNAETTMGPMVRKRNAEKVLEHIADAMEKSARKLIVAEDFPQLELPYLSPQVLVDVDHSMAVMTEETFGPVVGIMKVKSDDEAIRLMNDSQYGLTACIWTSDSERAVRIGDQVETGTWFMNRCDYLDPALAWNGVKNSGKGCTLSSLGYDYLTRPKSFHLKLK